MRSEIVRFLRERLQGSGARALLRIGIAGTLKGSDQRRPQMPFERITVDPQQMGGLPCIRHLRIPVATVVSMLAEGMSEGEILEAYPDLELPDLREALQFAAEAVRERELPLATSA